MMSGRSMHSHYHVENPQNTQDKLHVITDFGMFERKTKQQLWSLLYKIRKIYLQYWGQEF